MAEIKEGVKAEIKKRAGLGIEELLLFFLIILNILEFAGLLTFELSYIDNIIDWVCLGYLWYLVSPTEIFYGYKDKFVDVLFIIAYFSLVMTDFVGFTADDLGKVSAVSDSFLVPFYVFVAQHALTIVMYSIYIGFSILLLIASFNLFMNVEIKEPSILAIFHSTGPAQGIRKKIERAISSFLLSMIFFFVVFKIIIEWLGWVVDSSIFILALFFYLFFVLKHAKKFNVESTLFKLGSVGEEFYSRFISLFHSRKTIFLGIIGILVLHLLTELGVFILPYLIGGKISYFGSLGPGHTFLYSLLMNDLSITSSLLQQIAVVLVYLFNIIAVLFILVGPAYIWYDLYNNRFMSSRKWIDGLVFGSIAVFLLNPAFKIGRIVTDTIAGADITTMQVNVDGSMFAVLVGMGVFILIWIVCYSHFMKMVVKYLFIFLANIFFGMYLYFFGSALAIYHVNSLASLGASKPALSLFLLSSLIIMVLFYVTGFAAFAVKSFSIDLSKYYHLKSKEKTELVKN